MHWVRRKPKGMRVEIRVLWRIRSTGTLIASAQVLGGCENHVGKVSQMKYVPDTSAMDTCAGPALLNKLNMAQVTLISPNSQSIVTANKPMHIMGAVMAEF